LNAILPAQAGTVAMVGLLRAEVHGSTVLGMVGAGVVQNAFYLIVGGVLCVFVVVSRPAAFDLKAGWLTNHLLLGAGLGRRRCLLADAATRRDRGLESAAARSDAERADFR
jgi:hypothetical protein